MQHKMTEQERAILKPGLSNLCAKLEARRRIDSKLRAAINADLDVAGFGGGRRFQRIGQALTAVCDVLEKHGLEPAVVFSAHTFDRPKGHRLIDLAFSNPADSFSPTAVENCGLSYTWENIGVDGNDSYEVIAYIS